MYLFRQYLYLSFSFIEKRLFVINKIFHTFFGILFFLTIFICIFFIPTNSITTSPTVIDFIHDSNLLWPTPGITKINSYFGKRIAPTNGASTYHKGIDIGAPEGFEFVAVTDGIITFVGFLGGGGYTITLTDGNTEKEIKYTYCHCDPNFMVNVGDRVVKGQIIGKVGPKYVDGVVRKSV